MTTATMIAQNVTADRMESHREWMKGFNAYMDGTDFDQEQSVNWRKGWKQAYAGEGECRRQDAAAYTKKEMDAMTDEYADDIADREWWARGCW